MGNITFIDEDLDDEIPDKVINYISSFFIEKNEETEQKLNNTIKERIEELNKKNINEINNEENINKEKINEEKINEEKINKENINEENINEEEKNQEEKKENINEMVPIFLIYDIMYELNYII